MTSTTKLSNNKKKKEKVLKHRPKVENNDEV
jgi:hypothetical protein